MNAARCLLSPASALTIVCLNALVSPSALADIAKTGTTSTVKGPLVKGIVGTDTSDIVVGKDIFADETVQTDDGSSTELMFLDQTNLTVTPGSSVKIDKFVFDPNVKKGAVVFNVARGSLRFVTGSQDPTSYEIKTPVATIGVRGTIVNFVTTASGLAIQLQDGSASVIGADGASTSMTPATQLAVFGATGTVATAANGDLAKAVTTLLASSPSKATMAAALLVVAGDSSGKGAAATAAAVAAGVASAGIPADALATAVKAAVTTATNPGTAATAIVSSSATLPADVASSTGAGLATAATSLAASDPNAARAIVASATASTNAALAGPVTAVAAAVATTPPAPPPPPNGGAPLSPAQLGREYQNLPPETRAALIKQLNAKGIDGLASMSESDARTMFNSLPASVKAQIQAKWDGLSDEQRIAMKKTDPGTIKQMLASQLKQAVKPAVQQSLDLIAKPVEAVVKTTQAVVDKAATVMQKTRDTVQNWLTGLRGQTNPSPPDAAQH